MNPTQQVPTTSTPYTEEKVYWPADPTLTTDVTYGGEMMGMRYDDGFAEHFDDAAPRMFLGTKEQITSRFQSDTPATDFKYLIRRPRFIEMPLISGTASIPNSIGSPAYAADSGHVQLTTAGLTNNNIVGMVVDIGRSASIGGASGGILTLTGATSVVISPPQFGCLQGLLVQGFNGAGGLTQSGGTGAGSAAPNLIINGGAGGATSSGAGTAGGAGGALQITLGPGGAQSVSSGTAAGGVGGAMSVTLGAGGNASGAASTGNGGAGGALTITCGAGGTSIGGTSGAGGAITMTCGAGGAQLSGATAGAGGALSIAAGAGGAGTATGTGAVGGNITIAAGAGGSTSGAGTGGNGGNVTINPGAGGTTTGGTAGNPGKVTVCGAQAPANAATTACLYLSSTANLGIYVSNAAPTFSAAQGSLCLNTTGNSTSSRLYVNTNGGTTWTNFTSAT